MMIQACNCNWDIAGVDRLPSHTHSAWARVRHNGREFTVRQHDAALNPGLTVMERGEDIHIWVNWKEVARG